MGQSWSHSNAFISCHICSLNFCPGAPNIVRGINPKKEWLNTMVRVKKSYELTEFLKLLISTYFTLSVATAVSKVVVDFIDICALSVHKPSPV